MHSVGLLSDFAYRLRYEDMPQNVVQEAKRILLDSIGCAASAHVSPKNKILQALSFRIDPQANHPGGASVFGWQGKYRFEDAIFANAELINELDYDVLVSPPGHVAPYVIPPILAYAEIEGRSGREVIKAIAIACEISSRFGKALANVRAAQPGEITQFPDTTGYSSTVFGGTLAGAILAGLSQREAEYALGLAGHIAPVQSMGKWVRTQPASSEKYVMAGWLAQTQAKAIQLAAAGYTGNTEVLDGPYGFWRFIGSAKWQPEKLAEQLGEVWNFPIGTKFKPYPHCRISQTALECLKVILKEQQLHPDDIDHVQVLCDPHGAALPMWTTQEICNSYDAQMSVPYAVALVAHGIEAGSNWYSESIMTNPEIRSFMKKVSVEAHPDFDKIAISHPGSRLGKVIVMAKGKRFDHEMKYRKGSPAAPDSFMTNDELAHKFMANWSGLIVEDKAARMRDALLDLEFVENFASVYLP